MNSNLHFSVPDISDFYSLKQSDFQNACRILGDAFREDPIWKEIMKDESSKFSLVFGVPLKYTLKYGKVYAPSQDLSAIAAWLPTPYVNMTFWRLFRSGSLAIAMKLGLKIGNQASRVSRIIDKDRKTLLHRPFLYLFVLGVSPQHQEQGLGTLLVRKMIEHMPNGIPLYLETETESNVRFYQRLGFHVVKEIRIPVLDLPMWEMLHNGT